MPKLEDCCLDTRVSYTSELHDIPSTALSLFSAGCHQISRFQLREYKDLDIIVPRIAAFMLLTSLLISDELNSIHRHGLAIYIFEYLVISK